MIVGLLTIGQSPRTDVIPELMQSMTPKLRIVEMGALDGIDEAELHRWIPTPGDRVLVSRLASGREVKLARERIVGRLQECIAELEGSDCGIIILLCTGDFDELESTIPLLYPERILRAVVQSLSGVNKLGVMTPLPEQVAQTKERWKGDFSKLVIESASPYSGSSSDFEKAASHLQSSEVDLVVLDCIGYDNNTRVLVKQITKTPVILPRTLVGRVATELLS